MTIEEIYNSEDISVRSFNVCNDNGLKDLAAILNYYQENKTFDNLRNCGRKSNEEIIALCLKYVNKKNIGVAESRKIKDPLISIISNLTRAQREIVNSFIEINLNNLTTRSRNAIITFLNENLKIRNFSERILINEKFNIQDIKNVGSKTTTELNSFIFLIKDFVENISNTKDENELISLKNRIFIEKSFSISEIPAEILESSSIFKLADFLLTRNVIFEKNQNTIFKKTFKVYRNQNVLTLDEMADVLNLTRERVRQIRKSILEDLFVNLQFFRNVEDDLFQKYSIDINSNHLEIDKEIVDIINIKNNTNLSQEFITYILFAYLWGKFSLIGEIEDVLQPIYLNARNRHNWKNFYLIEKNIVKEVDFIGLANDIDNRINDKIVESYSFNFKSYLSRFLIDNNIDVLNSAFPIAENIINEEFEMNLDLNENIMFNRNTLNQVPDYIIEALENLNKPSKLSEIYEWICIHYPEATKSEEALRSSCRRSNEIIYFGRSSTFGLKKWENTKNDIKGGTIKDIVTELLENSNTPIHITEILEEVHKYRAKTNERNIITNLKLDPNKSFIIFNQKFIGLSNKVNDYDLIKYEKLPIQLGRIIKGKLKKNTLNDINQMSKFLNKNYDLTFKETKNILHSLNMNL